MPRPKPAQIRRFLALLGVATAGCFPPNNGRSPPLDRLYFPVGLATNPDASRLYVANSDFDLQFNAGTVQAYDLSKLRQAVPQGCMRNEDCVRGPDGSVRNYVCDTTPSAENGQSPSFFCVNPSDPRPCGDLGEKTAADRLVAPGRCEFADEQPYIAAAVRIGAFVTDVVYRKRHDENGNPVEGQGGRLFLPVRGDATLHWIDVPDVSPGSEPSSERELQCGQDSTETCDGDHRRGDDPASENTRDVRLPPEPYGVAVDERGEALVTTHQTSGAVSLFVNSWGNGGSLDGPRLQFVLTGLPLGALGAAAVPVSEYVQLSQTSGIARDGGAPSAEGGAPIAYDQGFLVTFRNTAEVRLVRYVADPTRPFLEASRSAAITTNSQGWDSRGIAIDDSARRTCEDGCATKGDPQSCRKECVTTYGLDTYIANRAPSSIVLGQTHSSDAATATDDLPHFYGSLPVSAGVTRVVVASVKRKDGELATRIFAVCFDSKKIFVYDPKAHRIESIIETGNGPQAIAVDGAHGLGYVAHFSESYLGVVDLDQSHVNTYGQMLYTVGRPTPPRAAK